jgi:hypothetical protein
LAELIIIKPEHPFSSRELFFFALCLGALAWVAPFVVDLSLAYVPGLQYPGSGLEGAVKNLGRPVLMGLGAAVLGFCSPRRGWFFALTLALADVFLWIVRAGLAAGQADVDRLQVLVPSLLRILALTVLPAAVTGSIMYIVRD